MDLLQTTKTLATAVGVSGQETAVSAITQSLLSQYTDKVEIDAFHNVYATIKPTPANGQTVLLEAHLDEIGMIVCHIDDKGFLKVAACGGMDRRLLLGQEVQVHCNTTLSGVICTLPPHLSAGDDSVPKMEDIAIDIGMSADRAKQAVSIGDIVTLKGAFKQLLGTRIASKSLDNRIGVVAVLQAVEQLQAVPLDCGLQVLFSVQEEVGLRGATMGGYRTHADWVISVDVSFGTTPDSDSLHSFPLGEGTLIGASPYLTKEKTDLLRATAKQANIPYHIEVMGGSTGTNADTLGVQRGGSQTSLLSIPQRYMHSPIEVIDMVDVQATADLLVAALVATFGGK